jgi:hypothetical protein
MNSTMDRFNQTTTIHRESIIEKLRLDQNLRRTRDQRSFEKFRETQKDWDRVNKKLMGVMNKNSTVMKDSFRNLYFKENESKDELIKDNIPEYWKHSLRGNNKRLKSHIRGHKFSPEKGEEMLQTLKGTRKIELSIPKLPDHHKGTNPRRMSLIGRGKYLNLTAKSSNKG